ncbi:MAG: hypothetical protein ACR2MS_07805 [Weeksellaceae bacterium]
MKKVLYCAIDASGTDDEFRLRVKDLVEEYCKARRIHTDFRVNMGCSDWDFEERVQEYPHDGVFLADLLDKD